MLKNKRTSILNLFFYLSLCGLFILGQLQRVELNFIPPFYIHDLLLSIWLGITLIVHRNKVIKEIKSTSFSKYKLELFLLLWIIVGWFVSFVYGDLGFRFVFYSLRFAVYSLLFFLINKFKLVEEKILKIGFFFVGFYVLLLGLLQYVLLPDMRFLHILGWDDHLFRLVGTQFDPNFIGLLFVLLFFGFRNSNILKIKKLKYLLLTLILTGLALTFSRSSYLSFIVAFVLSTKVNPKKYISVVLLLVLIFLAPKPTGEGVDLTRTSTVLSRITSSQKSISNLKPYQYFVGQGLFNKSKSGKVTENYVRSDHGILDDNLILLIFNSTGIVGLTLMALLLKKHLLLLYKKDKTKFIIIIAVMTHALFNNSVFQPFIFIYLSWSLISKIDR